MSTQSHVPSFVWIKREWNLKSNPFPREAVARLGGTDVKENGLLFTPSVQDDKVQEATEKFVLGGAIGGLKFGYLWSLGTGLGSDARGFGKSSLMQYLVEQTNLDFGRQAFLDSGLDEAEAEENPVCAVLASFDTANARSLNAVFFDATRYACRFKAAEEQLTLAERIRNRLVDKLGSDEPTELVAAVHSVQSSLLGRTLGPPAEEFLHLLCSGDQSELAAHIDSVTPNRRTRNGASYLATLLVVIKTAGINHVILCCDQLEDFAATTTTRQKRTLETERFRDYVLETQPMSDMLTCVVTMHPRATRAIGEMWYLADLPSYEHDRPENRHRIVVLERVKSKEKARILVKRYIDEARTAPHPDGNDIYPFSEEAIEALFIRAEGKPRDLLRKANTLVFEGAEQNWDIITGDRVEAFLDSFAVDDEDDFPSAVGTSWAVDRRSWA